MARQARIAQSRDLLQDLVLDAANLDMIAVEQEIAGAPIAVVRRSDAPRVRHRESRHHANEGYVNVSVHDETRVQLLIRDAQFVVGRGRAWRAPRALDGGVYQRQVAGTMHSRKRPEPCDALRA